MQNPFDVKKLFVEAMTGSRIPNPSLSNIKDCLIRIYKYDPKYSVEDESDIVLKEFSYYDKTIVSVVDGISFVGSLDEHQYVEEIPYKKGESYLIFGGEIWKTFTDTSSFIDQTEQFAKYNIPDNVVLGNLGDSLDFITDLFCEERIFGIKTTVFYVCALVSAMKEVSKLDSIPFRIEHLAKYMIVEDNHDYTDKETVKRYEKFIYLMLDSFENDGEPMNKLAILAEYKNTHEIY